MTQGKAVVGREAERLAIDHWLAGPRPSALLLAGEAGIGFHDALAAARRTALAAACGRIIADREQPPGTDLIGLAVADLLRALDHWVLLAIDDLQWMDEPSARVLAFALRRLREAPVGLIATWRTGPTTRQTGSTWCLTSANGSTSDR